MNELPHDLRQLFAILRSHLGRPDPVLLTSPIDWTAVLRCGTRHVVAQMLYVSIGDLPQELRPPPEVVQHLRALYLHVYAQNTALLLYLRAVLDALETAGLQAMVLKGAALAEWFYGDIALRQMSDLDILIRREDLDRARRVLRDFGCTPPRIRVGAEARQEEWYRGPPGAPILDVHVGLRGATAHGFRADETDGVWQRAVTVPLAGATALVPCPEDMLCHLCVHLSAVHALRPGVGHALDLAKVIDRAGRAFDWPLCLDTARRWRIERSVRIALELSHEWLGVELPSELSGPLDPEGQWVLAMARHAALRPDEPPTMPVPMLRFCLGGAPWRLLRRAWVAAFPPPAYLAELRGLDYDSKAVYLYYPAHIFGLVTLALRTMATRRRLGQVGLTLVQEARAWEWLNSG